MEDPKYYELRNFALEFLFSRYAHHEEDEATDSEIEAVALPMPLPASKKPAVAETANRAIAPTPFVHHAAVVPEASPIKRGILSVSWLVAMATLAAVNMSAVSSQLKQAKLGQTAPQATTATAVVSSPPSPQIAASSIAPNASPAPIAAASPAPIAAASPAPIAAASPAPIAAAATAASSATANSATAPNAATSATSEISDQTELDAIGQQLYAQIDKNWSITPTFTESLTYRVKVKENGDILQFDPTNKAAKDFVKETPLPILQTPAGATAGAEKTAEFQVTFSPTNGGVLEVKTGK
jgi:bicarbonate transport system ATP-binding protein